MRQTEIIAKGRPKRVARFRGNYEVPRYKDIPIIDATPEREFAPLPGAISGGYRLRRGAEAEEKRGVKPGFFPSFYWRSGEKWGTTSTSKSTSKAGEGAIGGQAESQEAASPLTTTCSVAPSEAEHVFGWCSPNLHL